MACKSHLHCTTVLTPFPLDHDDPGRRRWRWEPNISMLFSRRSAARTNLGLKPCHVHQNPFLFDIMSIQINLPAGNFFPPRMSIASSNLSSIYTAALLSSRKIQEPSRASVRGARRGTETPFQPTALEISLAITDRPR